VNRRQGLERFYETIQELVAAQGLRLLSDATAADGWPSQGVYFFFEPGEPRENGQEMRVVRIGTHAVSSGSSRTLWQRLATHRGTIGGESAGGGNHRGSIFRLHIGNALIASGIYNGPGVNTWGVGSSAPREVRKTELPIERAVSSYIGTMPLVCLAVPGEAGPANERAFLERNSIALLSNLRRDSIDPPSSSWLGGNSPHPSIRESGLWNVRHVETEPDCEFLDRLRAHVRQVS
jgi:hypothetical protein